MRRLCWLAWVALALGVGAPATASAQPAPAQATPAQAPSAPDYARANEVAGLGFDAFDRGRFAEAHGHFERAEAAAHSPVFLLYMARCKRELGELDAARALYEKVTEEELADDAPVPFRSAQDDANAELAQLEALTPALSITLEGLLPNDRVTLDGRPATMRRQGSVATLERELTAGSHVLKVTRDGAVIAERAIELETGQTVDTSIVLPAPAPSPAPPAPAPAPATITQGPNLVPAYIVLGFAGAGAVIGSVMGGLALSQDKTAVDELTSCEDDAACAAAEETRDRAVTYAHVSTTAFVVASVAAATGVVLILTASEEEVAVGVGPGSVDLTIRF